LEQLTKDISSVDLDGILSCWRWCIADIQAVITISALGDIFFIGKDGAVYWLQTDSGEFTKTAENMQEFQEFLKDEQKVDNWFLPSLIDQLLTAGKTLNENEVYSFKKLPVIGGEYSVDNLEPTDMTIHFTISGQICEQIKNWPDGTKVRIKVKN
jgi:hypothetical protein